ncbi:MAG: InlB B-repeat-containing protein, partial [Clostridia bacterium]|nr:InlB B-repeat-containing protein [Clostridia bacterium]
GQTYIGYNASFDASVRFGNTNLEGNIQVSLVPTKVEDKVENKLYASVYGSFGTLDAKIYLADNVAYVNIQGLKIKVELSKDEINNILAWVNDKFDKEFAFDSLSDGVTFEIPDLSTLQITGDADQLFVGLGKFKVNTTKFEDIVVKLNSSELLDDIIIATNVYDNNITEIGSTDFENADWETADTIHKNLVFHLNNFTYGNFVSTITLGNNMLLGGVAQSEFVDYSKVLDFVDALIDYANSGEYAFTLNATVNEYNPATNQTKLYAKAENAFFEIHNAKNGTTDSKINIDYLYASGMVTLPNNAKNRTSEYLDHKFSGVLDSRNGDNKLYATYSNAVSNFSNSLKLKIDTNTLLYFASIALKLFDVETQSGIVSKFANLPNVDDLDVSNLRYLVGVEPVDVSDFEQIDNLLSKAKDYIDKVKSIEFVNRIVNGKEENYLVLNVEINDEVMEFRINTLDGMLKYIGAENVQVTRARNMNLTLDVTEFRGTNNYNKSANHFDLTNLKDLVTSFVNNSKYNDFHITGTLDISITLAGIIPITLNVPLDAKIKLVDKKPQVMITLTIPVLHPLYNVNDDMSSWASERTVKIYYADGYLYTYRTEKSGKYEKKVKQELATLGDSIMEYVQYITGLNDDIMSKISEAMDKTINRTTPIDFTDVISNYSYTSSSSAHNITINLKELANNDQLDTAALKLYTSYLNSAKYIQKAELDVEMPVATGVDIAIKSLSSSGSKDPLKLVDIGSTVNISELTSYISSYTYGVDEFWVKNNGGSWKKESDQEYTITFDSLGGASVADITNKAGTPITLPHISSNKTNTVDNIQYIYSFAGWTLDSMGAGEIVTWSTQPRGNKTLYAVWNIIDTKTLITFVTNSDYSVSSIRKSVGSSITLPTISGVKNVDGTSERKEYTFAGWYYDSACTNAANISIMPSENVTLYAKWVLSRTVSIYTVTFVSNGATTYNSTKVEAGTTLDVSSYTPHKHDTTEWKKEKHSGDLIKKYYHYHTHYTFAGWYTNSGLTNRFNGVVNSNLTLYGKYTTSVTNHLSTALIPSASQKCDDSCEWC